MDQPNLYPKPINSTSLAQVNTDRSSIVTYGEGYVYTGPLTPLQYDLPSRPETFNQNSSTTPSTANLSLASSPSAEMIAPNPTNQYQFKVMLLGDSGVGKLI